MLITGPIEIAQGNAVRKRDFRIWQSVVLVAAATAVATNILAVFLASTNPTLLGSKSLALASGVIFDLPLALLAMIIVVAGVRTGGVALMAFAMALASLSDGLSSVMTVAPKWGGRAGEVAIAAVATLAAGAFIRTAQLFPKRLVGADVFSAPPRFMSLRSLRVLLAMMLPPWVAWLVGALWFLGMNFGATALLAQIGLLLVGAAFWHIQYRVGTAKAKRRVVWFLQLTLTFALLNVLAALLISLLKDAGLADARAWVVVGYNFLIAVSVCGSIAMAVFSVGAINPSLVLRATVVYGVAAGVLLFILNIITSVAIDRASEFLGVSDRLIAATLGAVAGLVLDRLTKTFRAAFEDWHARRRGREGSSTEPAG